TGQISVRAAAVLTVLAAALFVAAAAAISPLCGALAPVALALVCGYSYSKRFTWACHLVLGLAIAAAPVGASIAMRGTPGAPAGARALAVATWVGGFDDLYALSDLEFDRAAGLCSIPARFGARRALVISAALHLVTLLALIALGYLAGLGAAYFGGVALIG